tara:strand:- start:225 stop:797 length:573 start_codon:yes stop_codon:yes gene_type:complete
MTRTDNTSRLLTPAQLDAIEDAGWIDMDAIDSWTEATGLDLAHRTLARLLALNNGIDRAVVFHSSYFDWTRGEDAKYRHFDRTTQGVKFSHSRNTATLEVYLCIEVPGVSDTIDINVLIQADRLGQNGKIRNARVTLGYRVGAELEHFVACDDSPNARSIAIYRALGATAQADAMQREIDNYTRAILANR